MNLKTFSLTLGTAFIISASFAQTITYTSPETDQFKPVLVKAEDAFREAAAAGQSCGYTKAFFAKADLVALMNVAGCVGIRIYNSKESSTQAHCDVIAVAVDAAGKEIGPAIGNKYLHAKSYDENTSCVSKKITKTKAEGCVKIVSGSGLSYQKVFFSRALIDERLKNGSGIAVLPSNNGSQSTMMIAAASLTNGQMKEMESNYFKSQLPCPTDCGDTANYLFMPN